MRNFVNAGLLALVISVTFAAVPAFADSEAESEYEQLLREIEDFLKEREADRAVKTAREVQQYHSAAEQGDAEAQYHLGMAYRIQSPVESAKWYRKAADQGHREAQFKLGIMYYHGTGIPQYYIRAHIWFNLAAAQGQQNAHYYRDRVAAKMNSAQIAEAQRLAEEWRPK